MDYLNKITKLNITSTNLHQEWNRFKRDFNYFATAAEISKKPTEVQVSFFHLAIGSEANDLLPSLGLSDEDTKSLKKIQEAYEKYCSPKRNVIFQRFIFEKRNQKEHETLEEFINEVRTLATTCEFDNHEERIRDRLIFGLIDSNLRDKIMFSKENSPGEIINKLRAHQLQIDQIKEVNHENSPSKPFTSEETTSVDYIKKSNTQKKPYKSKLPGCKDCFKRHDPEDCWMRDKFCNKCKRKGHEASVCQRNVLINEVSKNSPPKLSDDDLVYSCDAVKRCVNNQSVWCQNLKTGNVFINFKLDTGAEINTIPLSTLNSIEGDKKIRKTKIKLKGYFGDVVQPVGEVELSIQYKDKSYKENFIIVNQNIKPLLGLESCFKLGLMKRIYSITKKTLKFMNVINKLSLIKIKIYSKD